MKRVFGLITIFIFVISCLGLTVGCGNNNKKDYTTTITVEPFSGSGFGYEWLQDLGKEWSAINGKYVVDVKTTSYNMSRYHLDEIKSNTTTTDLYFGAEPYYSEGFYRDYFEDLTDLLDKKPDGDGGLTVREKIIDFDGWKKSASKVIYSNDGSYSYGSELYMLPYTMTFAGMIFDYKDWLQNGYLTYAAVSDKEAVESQGIVCEVDGDKLKYVSSVSPLTFAVGEYITTPGKDGKYGTYDDGQPITLKEFDTLIRKINAKCVGEKNGKAIMYSSADEYVHNLTLALFAQYMGMDAYSAIAGFDSHGAEIELYDGSKEVITWENGYKAYSAKGIKEVVEFTHKYFSDSAKTYYGTQETVQGAQGRYITNPKSYKILIEGNWFETEAKPLFTKDNPYGTIDYRFLLLPEMEGQKGIDGQGKGSFFAADESGAILIRKQQDSEKLAAIKDFLLYVLKEESLTKTTMKTGLIQRYNYTLSNEQISQMTPFLKTCYNIFHDEENIKILTYSTDRISSPFPYAVNSGFYNKAIPVDGYSSIVSYFQNYKTASIETVVDKIYNNYSEQKWATFMQNIKDNLAAK